MLLTFFNLSIIARLYMPRFTIIYGNNIRSIFFLYASCQRIRHVFWTSAAPVNVQGAWETSLLRYAMNEWLEMRWNESGFRPPLCTYRLNWANRTPWGWWDEWDDTLLQTQDSKFEPWRSEAEHATSRSWRLPTILSFARGREETFLFLSNRRDREPNTEL